jgi:hypothetical protein
MGLYRILGASVTRITGTLIVPSVVDLVGTRIRIGVAIVTLADEPGRVEGWRGTP